MIVALALGTAAAAEGNHPAAVAAPVAVADIGKAELVAERIAVGIADELVVAARIVEVLVAVGSLVAVDRLVVADRLGLAVDTLGIGRGDDHHVDVHLAGNYCMELVRGAASADEEPAAATGLRILASAWEIQQGRKFEIRCLKPIPCQSHNPCYSSCKDRMKPTTHKDHSKACSKMNGGMD
jgi:hypothetical protein